MLPDLESDSVPVEVVMPVTPVIPVWSRWMSLVSVGDERKCLCRERTGQVAIPRILPSSRHQELIPLG